MYDGGIRIETYSAEAGRDVASMVDNEQLKSTAKLPLYISSEIASHGRIFPRFCYLNFKKRNFKFLGLHVEVSVKTFPLMYQLPMNQ